MPEITEEQWKEYMALKRKEAIRQKEIKDTLEKGIKYTRKWRRDLNTIRGWASVFANILFREYERRGKPDVFVLDRWSRVKEYLPARVLTRKDGKIYLSKQFRDCLREYGWTTRIDRKYGVFQVTKIL